MNEKSIKGITRRDFLRGTAYAALFSALGLLGKDDLIAEKKTKVVLVRDPKAVDWKNRVNYEVILEMLDQAVMALTGEKKPFLAWRKIVKPEDIVGIKSNVWGPLPTPHEVENAIKKRLLDVGVKEKNIKIRDRGVWRDSFFRKANAYINVRPLRTHHWSGIGGCIKNYIPFVPMPWEYHGDSCASLASIWKLPHVKGKTRLNILLALTPLFHGIGPHHFNPAYVWPYRGIFVGKDPVALDALGVHLLQEKRKQYFGRYRAFATPVKHVYLADKKFHLGTSDLKKINLIKIGWKEGILI